MFFLTIEISSITILVPQQIIVMLFIKGERTQFSEDTRSDDVI